MSVTTEPEHAQPAENPANAPGAPGAPGPACEHCGHALEPDQEWCLECGAARTLIHRPPDWRIPSAVIGIVVLAVLAVFAIALINLSSQSNRSAGVTTITRAAASTTTAGSNTTAPATSSTPTTTAGTTTATASTVSSSGATTVRIPGWPRGLPGWTVAIETTGTRASARKRAAQLIASGLHVGVLLSTRHPEMAPGEWIVFKGRYPTQGAAQTEAATLATAGYPGATAELVARPGSS
jgi:hypothetical protein